MTRLEQAARTTVASVDRWEREQRTGFRWLLGIMFVGVARMIGAMLATMAHGFHWL